ncbi:hypothetical protein [Calothrix parietina]|uniref:Uncharacterized protein n=1 Tax=Calothrix anomala FACHB-343 TaxID=2692894 RepID=A0ABR8AZ70_9CYAN|nr:hypothetical protein [Calothrix anomala FACHB-343]
MTAVCTTLETSNALPPPCSIPHAQKLHPRSADADGVTLVGGVFHLVWLRKSASKFKEY